MRALPFLLATLVTTLALDTGCTQTEYTPADVGRLRTRRRRRGFFRIDDDAPRWQQQRRKQWQRKQQRRKQWQRKQQRRLGRQ
jgi:hypothetical protein